MSNATTITRREIEYGTEIVSVKEMMDGGREFFAASENWGLEEYVERFELSDHPGHMARIPYVVGIRHDGSSIEWPLHTVRVERIRTEAPNEK